MYAETSRKRKMPAVREDPIGRKHTRDLATGSDWVKVKKRKNRLGSRFEFIERLEFETRWLRLKLYKRVG